MRKIIRIIKKVWSYFVVQILNVEIKETRTFNGISLTINRLEKGGRAYFSRSSYRDSINPFYTLIQKIHNPNIVLDIGANYGFTSSIYAKVFKNARIFSIEPSKILCDYIELNNQANSNANVTVIQAICDEKEGEIKDFSINPLYSQDNRVKGDSILWKKVKTTTISIDSILNNIKTIHFVFIKIDTQGYEKSVFLGGEQYLLNNTNWLIKSEFSPFSLQKQGTDPKIFLKYLIQHYDVIDFNGEVAFNEDSIESLFKNKLLIGDVDTFIDHIKNRDHKEIGWSDLLIKSQKNNI